MRHRAIFISLYHGRQFRRSPDRPRVRVQQQLSTCGKPQGLSQIVLISSVFSVSSVADAFVLVVRVDQLQKYNKNKELLDMVFDPITITTRTRHARFRHPYFGLNKCANENSSVRGV